MIVAAHQPDLLPYSGFWYKMHQSNVFELGIYYQFVDRGYQRRVKMRDQWASLPIVTPPTRSTPIKDVMLQPGANRALIDIIRGRYAAARYFKTAGSELLDRIDAIQTDRLWQFNLELILGVRDMLGITTPVAIGAPLRGVKSAAIVNSLMRYGSVTTHLAGTGAKEYMGTCEEFTAVGIDVEWSRHQPTTGDSIVSVLMDYKNPLSIVLAERRGVVNPVESFA